MVLNMEDPQAPQWGMMHPPDVVGTALAPQLGTSRRILQKSDVDMRILSVFEKDIIGMLLYAKIKAKKSKVWDLLYDEILHLFVSVGGRGRRDIIRMEIASRGGGANVESEIQKPGWLRRNVTDRGWRDKQIEEKGL